MADQRRRNFELYGKVALVTGASAGIGREFCIDLAKCGCRIIAAARRIDRLSSLCDEINSLRSSSSFSGGVRAVGVELDVCADGETIDCSVQKGWDAFGRIDVVINNAGMRGNIKSPLDTTEEEWDTTFRTNLTGLWLVSKSVCTRMRNAKIGGSIINISSTSGLNRGYQPGSAAYSASKAAVNTLTKAMAMEFARYKVRVNSIAPGLFRSEITDTLMDKEWLTNVAIRAVPLRTFGTTDPALTSLVQYLIDDSSDYVTGNIFIVDAGATLPGVPIFSSL